MGDRGIYEVTETSGAETGQPDSSPWVWDAAGQFMLWLAVQAVGVSLSLSASKHAQ
jgi:hypothetical protein